MVARRLAMVRFCADDYGISPGVSHGICELAAQGRLSATGVMAGMASWPGEAGRLRELDGVLAVGLHLTLTDQRPLGAMPSLAPAGKMPGIGALIAHSLAGRLPIGEVEDEIIRQLDSFESHFGRPPDFVDGHQHVHLLPGIRRIVLSLFETRLDRRRCWLRDCSDALMPVLRRPLPLKAGFIAVLGRPLVHAARARGIRSNRGFSGFYDAARLPFEAALPRMLDGALDGHLLMIHPGHVDDLLVGLDSLTAPRQAEWQCLMADGFPERLAKWGLALAGPGFPG